MTQPRPDDPPPLPDPGRPDENPGIWAKYATPAVRDALDGAVRQALDVLPRVSNAQEFLAARDAIEAAVSALMRETFEYFLEAEQVESVAPAAGLYLEMRATLYESLFDAMTSRD